MPVLDILWLGTAAFIVVFVVMARQRLRGQILRLKDRREQLAERHETFVNYSKLASVRIAEGEAQRDELKAQIAERRAAIEQSVVQAITADRPTSTYYVFDRVAGRKGRIWAVHVECTLDDGPWAGTRAYVVVAETAEDARSRVSDRFPQKSSFSLAQPEAKSF